MPAAAGASVRRARSDATCPKNIAAHQACKWHPGVDLLYQTRTVGGRRSESGARTTVDPVADDARRALVLHDRALVVDLIELTLNHGLFVVRAAANLSEAEAILAEWRPHLSVVDMDHDDSGALLRLLGTSNSLTRSLTPVLGLTRR